MFAIHGEMVSKLPEGAIFISVVSQGVSNATVATKTKIIQVHLLLKICVVETQGSKMWPKTLLAIDLS